MTLLMTRKGRRVAVAGMSFMVTLVTRLLAAVRMTDHWKMSRATRGLNTSRCCCAVVGHNSHNSSTAPDSRQPAPGSIFTSELGRTGRWTAVTRPAHTDTAVYTGEERGKCLTVDIFWSFSFWLVIKASTVFL